jgi:hypothetical protein
MATNSNNPAGQVNVPGPSVSHPIFRGAPVRGWSSASLIGDDNEFYSLGSPGDEAAGLYICTVEGAPENMAIFAVTTASGAVTGCTLVVLGTGADWAADGTTNDKYHLYDSSGELFLKTTFDAAVTLNVARLI